MEHSPRTAGDESHQRGGWGWLLAPALLMFLAGQLVFGIFMMRLADYEAAVAASLAVLPVTLSVSQLVLLWIAWRQLRASRISVRDLVGFERGALEPRPGPWRGHRGGGVRHHCLGSPRDWADLR